MQRQALRVLFFLLLFGSGGAVADEQSRGVHVLETREETVFPVDWLDSGVFVLSNGDRIILSGVFVPSLRYLQTAGGRKQFFPFQESLRDRVLSKTVKLYSYETKRDRYRTRYGDLYVGNYGEWLQSWLVGMGWSWTLPSSWAVERNRVLLLAEKAARSEGRGFWGTGDFKRVRRQDLSQKDGFVMLRGVVSKVDYMSDGWRLDVDGIDVFVPVQGYIASPKEGELVEIRGRIFWRGGIGNMRLKSHHQLLDAEGYQWYDRHSSR